MTDREMVQKAADAIGLKLHWDVEGVAWKKWPSFKWNPLVNSADAFELMVSLEIQVGIGCRRIDACAVEDGEGSVIRATENKVGDLFAATRRAITRAAAAIQEAKEGV